MKAKHVRRVGAPDHNQVAVMKIGPAFRAVAAHTGALDGRAARAPAVAVVRRVVCLRPTFHHTVPERNLLPQLAAGRAGHSAGFMTAAGDTSQANTHGDTAPR